MIKVDYEHYFHDDEQWRQRAINISKKIYLATEYFVKFTNLAQILDEKNKNKQKTKITYHDPCHARKMQGVWKEPRELLKRAYILNEMSDNHSCCGFGGVTMQSEKYHLSRQAGQSRAAQINAVDASCVGSECSACKMQLNNALHIHGSNTKCANPIELIANAL